MLCPFHVKDEIFSASRKISLKQQKHRKLKASVTKYQTEVRFINTHTVGCYDSVSLLHL